MVNRDSFVFYRSFYECIKELPQKSAYPLLMALCEYALNGKESDLKGLEAGIFAMMKPQIDANNKRYENGKKGGRPPRPKESQNETKGYKRDEPNNNQSETKGYEIPKPNNNQDETKGLNIEANKNNQDETKTEPNENVNVNDNVNDKNTMCISKVNALFEKVWQLYPVKRGKGQVSLTAKKRLFKIGCEEITRAIERYTEYVDGIDYLQYQNGSTFFTSGYIDYLGDDYTPVQAKSKSKKSNDFNNFEKNKYDFEALEGEILSN